MVTDLFGEPLADPRGPGRPPFAWTLEKSNKVKVLYAAGYDDREIAAAIGCSGPTFRKVFCNERRERKVAALKLRAAVLAALTAKAVEQGDTSAGKAVLALIDREQARALSERMIGRAAAAAKAEKSAPKLGKKEEAAKRAAEATGLFEARSAPPLANQQI